ncbi:hypothetical protein H8356DRAFT_1657157 [Neocallimastix lanati (nom. inval.)]|uniref:Uncharacterized protein n=1 Tax=Neocallimastix californiae TaxID=1754190 RepID=A0A1Y2CUB7_9FUNG|nr:hypothetical protein H8356DRAFT_1657157 [Neocallimastix sp. JGI-2020a]ORY50648.1 hypothetical protein LY90DRAFT_702898 [Neocallimastix californiae]|eukprot:ORY50648.1 hypothetical protein LY90DRAFT_702898 [Neocallimastix californiae]
MSKYNSTRHDIDVIWLGIIYAVIFLCLALFICLIISIIIDCLSNKKERVGVEEGNIYVYAEFIPKRKKHNHNQIQNNNNDVSGISQTNLYYQTDEDNPYPNDYGTTSSPPPPPPPIHGYYSKNYYGPQGYYGPPPLGYQRQSYRAPMYRPQQQNGDSQIHESEMNNIPSSSPLENNNSNDNNDNNNNISQNAISISNENNSNTNATSPVNNS